MTTEELKALAECVTAAWEDIEGENLRDGHKQTMENLIFKTLQQVHREVQRRTREAALRKAAEKMLTQQLDPLNGSIRVEAFRDAEHLLVQMAEEDSER